VLDRYNAGADQIPASKLDLAREDFISAMMRLAEEQIPNNPHTALVEEILPKWQVAGSTPATAEHLTSRRHRFRWASAEERAKQAEARKQARLQIIEKWTLRFWLVGTDGKPADWIVKYAELLCQTLSGERRDGATRLGHPSGDRGPAIMLLPVLMKDPFPRDNEPFAEFKKRARHAVTAHLKRLEKTHALKNAVAPVAAKLAASPSPRKLDHCRWLVLYQCCAWTLADIKEKYGQHVNDDNAIWKGVQRKAQVLGIKLRPKRSNLTKQQPEGPKNAS
jgi:hypothetical protein